MFAPGASRVALGTAGLAVALVAAVLLVSALLSFLGTLSYAGATDTAPDGSTPLGGFFSWWLLDPLPFYVAAFLALAFLTPVLRRSPLPTIVRRAVLAGAAGAVGLMVVGVFEGFVDAIRNGDWTYLLTDIVTDPLSDAVEDAVLLVAACTVVWLWTGRPRRARRAAPSGLPGTVPPPDAVPPATVESPRPAPVWPAPPSAQGPSAFGQPGPGQGPAGR